MAIQGRGIANCPVEVCTFGGGGGGDEDVCGRVLLSAQRCAAELAM